MIETNRSWTGIYAELAQKLLLYKNDRKALINKIRKVFETINMKLPRLEENNNIVDIDPFTVFALFNKQIKDENRKTILKGFKKEFELNSDIPTGFEGLPTMMPLSATFYWFKNDRRIDDIQNIWDLYEAAFAYASSKSDETKKRFIEQFDITKQQNGISWRITTGLFWTLPDTFLSLDSRNRWYIGEYANDFSNELKESIHQMTEVPSGETYLQICESLKNEIVNLQYKDFIGVSNMAFIESERINKENKAKSKQDNNEIESEENVTHYWLYAPGTNADKWSICQEEGVILIGFGATGDLSKFESKDDIKKKMKEVYNPNLSFKNDAHAAWEFAKKMKVGDVIIVKKGVYNVIGRGIVESDYYYDEKRNDSYKHVRKVKWTNVGEWNHPGQAVQKALTDITQYTEYVQKLESLFIEEDKEEEQKETKYESYSKQEFLDKVFMDSAEYDKLLKLIDYKQNIILQGAPGVGKTFVAKRLAYSIIGEINHERVEMVQFHQSYSYEDFVIGYRPGETNPFELSEGVFYKFCQRAAEDDEKNPYFFIIDEINRGNISKIFGELFMLIEKDKHDVEIPLLYGKRKFKIPKNVYIIGTMNTADRSLAILDIALRRRFGFYTITPKFDNEKFNEYACGFDNEKFINLINTLKALNVAIAKDESLGEGFCIGHSFFCDLTKIDDEILYLIVENELIQLLKEYWFDEPSKVASWSDALRRAIR